jgi:ubiquinone/menaquinone biosynthesis C-methylase UbiE
MVGTLSQVFGGRSPMDAVAMQRAHYEATAARYDETHVAQDDGHGMALGVMMGLLPHLGIRSILDIGSGTGRALLTLKERASPERLVGIEPSQGLREQGYRKGLSRTELVDGDAQRLPYADGEFDMVCEFGALHHIPDPAGAVSEMLRVARKAIFISDSNNFGQGSAVARLLKQALNTVKLWPLADFIKTKGKGYTITEGDGLAYSYSVFNQYPQIRARCRSVHMFNVLDAGPNLYRSASHVALLGIR